MNLNTINDIASELFAALRDQKTIQPLTDKYPEMDINDDILILLSGKLFD